MKNKELEKKTGVKCISSIDGIKCISSIDGIKRFSFCVMNPPYSGTLHLQFLEKFIQISNKTVSIQPSNWIKPLQYRKPTTEQKNILNKISDFESIPGEKARSLFNAQMQDLGIYTCTKEGGYDYTTLYTKFPVNKIIEKITDSFKTVNEVNYNEKGIFVPLKLMTAEWDKNKDKIIDKLGILKDGKTLDGYYFKEKRNRNKERPCGGIHFNTINEAKNFVNCMNTDFFIKFINATHIKPRYILSEIPFLGNVKWSGKSGEIDGYKNEITDEMLYEYYKLTTEEINDIKNYEFV